MRKLGPLSGTMIMVFLALATLRYTLWWQSLLLKLGVLVIAVYLIIDRFKPVMKRKGLLKG
jgi:hypothetical protein